MQITLLYVGNAKDAFILEGCAEYAKRIGAYAKLTQIEQKETKVGNENAPSEVLIAIENEGKRLLEAMPPKSYKIALCVEGKEMSSPEFADKIEQIKNAGFGHIVFVIGGPYGMSEEVKKTCDFRLSVSKMTFSHRMCRLLLLEQVYRALNIASGGHYHK